MKSAIHSLIKSKITYAVILLVGILLFGYKSLQLSYSDFTITTPSGKTTSFVFPAFSESSESGIYTLRGVINRHNYASTLVRIIPDDEVLKITINSQVVNLDRVTSQERRDYNKGFVYDLGPYLHLGLNDVEILYSDSGGLMGVVFSAVPNAQFNGILFGLLLLIGILLAYSFFVKSHLKTSLKILILSALIIRIVYFAVTPPDVRDHDSPDHEGYIEYLAQYWVPPPLEFATGGAFFHPPLYYYTGAIVYKTAKIFEPNNKFTILRIEQVLSLVYSMGFVLFGLLILDQLISAAMLSQGVYRPFRASSGREPDNRLNANSRKELSDVSSSNKRQFDAEVLFWIIGSLFVFWPVAIIHSVRIGNDPMEYFLFTASLYYIGCWYREDKRKDLIIASLIGAAAILTKANGEILVAVLAVVGIYKMLKSKRYLDYFKLSIAPCCVMLIAVGITVAPGAILMLQGKREKLYIDNIEGLSHANLVGNTASNFLWLDAKTFVTEPFTDPYDDRMGRQFFWNYLGKTGLFGEFKYEGLACINTAVFSSLLLLIMLVYIVLGVYYMTKDDFKRQAVLLLSGFFLWAGITYMRMTFPANIDFRYIVPILLTFCSLYALSIITFQRRGSVRLANIGKVLSLLFTASGVVFILGVFGNGL
jgi:hypothetical protein